MSWDLPQSLALLTLSSCSQNTGRTEAWKVLNPQEGSWDNVARILSNGSLFLPAVGIQDEGTFRCRATSRSGKEIKSNYQIRVYGKGTRPFLETYLSPKSPSLPPLWLHGPVEQSVPLASITLFHAGMRSLLH